MKVPSAASPRPRGAGARVKKLAPVRNALIGKGMIWSPNHGDTAFTVPLFDEFMKRIMHEDDWREP